MKFNDLVKSQRNRDILKRRRKEPPRSKNFAEQFELINDVYETLEKSVQSLQSIIYEYGSTYTSFAEYLSESIECLNASMGFAEDFFDVPWDNVEYNDTPYFGDFQPFIASMRKAVFPYIDDVDENVLQIIERCKKVFRDLSKVYESVRDYYYNHRFFDDMHQNYAGHIMWETEKGLDCMNRAIGTFLN